MIDPLLRELAAGGWLYAAARIAFVVLIYWFLFLVLRATVGELHAAAQTMATGEGFAGRMQLVVLDGAGSSLLPGTAVVLQPVTLLGRDEENTVVIDDPHVSARHAELRFERGHWWLRDLGSSNGTSVNGAMVRAVVGVRAGDVIQCGRVRFRLAPAFSVAGNDASG
jgi:pSer/pThr/pTyr-binding forkhead associated (FHA) protein